MDTKSSVTERRNFRGRLVRSLLAAACDPKPTPFAKEFNLRATGATVTVHGARKWLMGEALPTQERLNILAKWLAVSPQWLRFGEEPKTSDSTGIDSSTFAHEEVQMLEDYRRLGNSSKAIVRDVIVSLLKNQSGGAFLE